MGDTKKSARTQQRHCMSWLAIKVCVSNEEKRNDNGTEEKVL
jgi:hypothetical protein